ncbi:MAG: hypothetical protein ABFC24_05465 [Methanoregulaceae archaeon]
MTAARSPMAPLKKLVLFMVILSVTGSILSGASYALFDLPARHAMQGPANTGSTVCSMDDCMKECNATANTGNEVTRNGYCTGYCRALVNRSEMRGLCSG